MRPKVTIVVPVYNAERYISICMSSLLSQTLKEIQIIAIDDGSTDDSLKILKRFANIDYRVHVLSQPDLGQGYTVNRGIDLAAGEYVAECDADDFVDRRMYERLYTFAKIKDCDTVRCNHWDLYGTAAYPSWDVKHHTQTGAYIFSDLPEEEKRHVLRRSVLLMPGIAKKSFLQKNGIRYREGRTFEDTSLSFKLRTAAERSGYINEYLYFYRKDNPGSGSATIKDKYSVREQYDEIRRWNGERGLHLEKMIGANRFYTYMWNLERMESLEDKEEFIYITQPDLFLENPTEDDFDRPEDWRAYNIFKYGHIEGFPR